VDPVSGHVFNVGMVGGLEQKLRVMHLDESGHMLQSRTVPLSAWTLVHDIGVTEKHVVVPIQPFELRKPDLFAGIFGLRTMGDGLRWYDDEPHSSFLVFNRSDLSLRATIRVPAFSSYHVCNAHDNVDGSLSVIIAVHRGDRNRLEEKFKSILTAEFDANMQCDLVRFDLNPDTGISLGSVTVSPSALPMEFPSVNPHYLGRPFTFAYSPCLSRPGYLDGYQKIDVTTGKVIVYPLPDGCYANECIFVPTSPRVKNKSDPQSPEVEDDGALMSLVYNSNSHLSEVFILNARTMERLARIPLPHHIPYHFHGTFVKEIL